MACCQPASTGAASAAGELDLTLVGRSMLFKLVLFFKAQVLQPEWALADKDY